jgi:hypothetical protein
MQPTSIINGSGSCFPLLSRPAYSLIIPAKNKDPDRYATRISPKRTNMGLKYCKDPFDQAPFPGWAAPCVEPPLQHLPMPPLWAHFFPQDLSFLHIFALSPPQHFISHPFLQQSFPQLS